MNGSRTELGVAFVDWVLVRVLVSCNGLAVSISDVDFRLTTYLLFFEERPPLREFEHVQQLYHVRIESRIAVRVDRQGWRQVCPNSSVKVKVKVESISRTCRGGQPCPERQPRFPRRPQPRSRSAQHHLPRRRRCRRYRRYHLPRQRRPVHLPSPTIQQRQLPRSQGSSARRA